MWPSKPKRGAIDVEHVSHYACTLCGAAYEKTSTHLTCPACGEKGILDVIYDYDTMRKQVDAAYFDSCTERSMWRYLPLMSVSGDRAGESLAVGWTPLYDSLRLAGEIDVAKLYLKDDGVNPTGSLKDRASAIAVLKADEEGHRNIACSSTGNAASSLAGNAARLGLEAFIFVPERAPSGKLTQLAAYGAEVISVEGDYKDAFNLSKAAIETFGWYNRNAAINPHMVEGKKTVALEIAEQLAFDVPDYVVVSVGDGCTIGGVYKGFYDLLQLGLIERIPRIVGVQAEGCRPFVDAAACGGELIECEERTLADSIAVGIPRNPKKALRAVRESDGEWVTVTDEEIIQAMQTLGAREGIFAEPAAAASLAGAIRARRDGVIDKAARIAVIVTGNGLKDPDTAKTKLPPPTKLPPDLDALKAHLKHTHDKEDTE